MRPLVVILLTSAVLAGSHASANVPPEEEDTPAVGAVLWPPEEYRTLQDLPELGQRALEAPDAMVMAARPLASLEVERLNETASIVTVQNQEGTTWSVTQRHAEPEVAQTSLPGGSTGTHSTLWVEPAQLVPSIEVTPTRGHGLLQITGPPGSFDVSGGTPQEIASELARKLGFPEPYLGWHARSLGTPQMSHPYPLPLHLYKGERACLSQAVEECRDTVEFKAWCEGCTELVGRTAPIPQRDFRKYWGDTIPMNVLPANRAHLFFDQKDRLVAAQFELAVDLHPEMLLDPAQAWNLTADHIRDQGYQIQEDPPDNGGLYLPLQSETIQLSAAQYRWRTAVLNASSGDHEQARVVQDARNGEILKSEFREAAVPENGAPGRVPSGSLLGSLIVVTLAARAIHIDSDSRRNH